MAIPLLFNADVGDTWMYVSVMGSHRHPMWNGGLRHWKRRRQLWNVLGERVKKNLGENMVSPNISMLLWPPTHYHVDNSSSVLVMPRKSSKNLCIHNVFALGPYQPTIPCLHPDCPRSFFNLSGHRNHIMATHLSSPPPSSPSNLPPTSPSPPPILPSSPPTPPGLPPTPPGLPPTP